MSGTARGEEFQRARREVACELREMRRIRRALLEYDKKKDERGVSDAGADKNAQAARNRLSRLEARCRAWARKLPESEREVFRRRVIKGESFGKIAADLFYKEESAKKIYTRALDFIAEKENA